MQNLNCMLVLLVSLLARFHMVSCESYFIVPTQNSICIFEPCLTLSQFANDTLNYIKANTTLIFAEGDHTLNIEISALNIETFHLLQMNNTDSNPTKITCKERARFSFTEVARINIHGITFIGCDGTRFESVDQLSIEGSRFLGQANDASMLTVVNTSVNVTDTAFLSNTAGTARPFSSSVGGALVVTNSTVSVESCHFERNKARIGGAIYSELQSNITITHSSFIANNATNCIDSQQCQGGALYIDGTSKIMIYNGTFENNTSDQNGGSVAIVMNNAYDNSFAQFGERRLFQEGTLIVEVTTFNNNRAAVDGGAVYIYRSNVTINYCEFSYNGANRYGGAIASVASTSLTVDNSQFFSNFAGVDGAAISVRNSTFLAENSVFMNNIASGSGGVMSAENYSTIEFTQECLFINNSASGEGGGVLHARMETSVLFDSCKLNNNRGESGGAIVLKERSISRIKNSTFEGNQASIRGGVFYIVRSGSSAIISNSNFSYNTATDYGGVATIRYRSELFANDSLFDHNSANLEGGVFDGYSATNIELYRNSFHNNTADNGGVTAIVFGSRFICEDSEFENNVNVDLGAAIRALNGNDVLFRNCNFTNNTANYGGALTVTADNTLNVFNCRFYGNKANSDGGVIYARIRGQVTVENCLFVRNSAINDGITHASDSSSITLNTNFFTDNVVGHDGGVAYAYVNSTLSLKNCTFVNNRAENSGGIAYGRNRCTITIVKSLIDSNMAQNSGGAVLAQDNTTISIEASNITNNTADYGGGLRVYVLSHADVSNCKFIGNAARVTGGAMATYERSTITINECTFVSNMANAGGVVIAYQNIESIVFDDNSTTDFTEGENRHLQRNAVEINNSSFHQNRGNVGGVVYVQSSYVNMDACSFEDNSARYDGGIFYSISDGVVNITNTNFVNSVADENGGVFILLGESRADMANCNLIGSQAVLDGGVIHIRQSTARIFNSTIDSSFANRNGGGIYVLKGTVEVEDSTFINNSATARGGAVYATTNSTLTAQQGRFIKNTAMNNSGGGLYFTEFSSGHFTGSNFELNRAKTHGGALYTTGVSAVRISFSKFRQNMANEGAALSARQTSTIYFDTSMSEIMSRDPLVQVHDNVANYGGGIYLSESNIYLSTETEITQNQAGASGGGIYAVNSSITIDNTVHFVSNQAEINGGGIYLVNSKLFNDAVTKFNVNFLANQADFGGGIFVNDAGETVVCSNNPNTREYFPSSECFFQSITKGWTFNFGNNEAKSRGEDLYGGLLDRCIVAVTDTNISSLQPIAQGVATFRDMSNLTNFETVSSEPVRLCICTDSNKEPDCDRQTHSIQVKNKDSFSLLVAVIDQVNRTISATVQSRFRDINLAESQRIRRIDSTCSSLEYRVSFPNVSRSYELTLFPEGPCDDKGTSRLTISVQVISCSCPPGFIPADVDTECSCICDSRYALFSKRIQECDSSTESVIRRGQFWITYFNDSNVDFNLGPYFIYPFCPFDYCLPSSEVIPIDLNLPNGSDAQCANNRGGLLCGSCQKNYSLSLGSSRCLLCRDKWHGLLEGIIIAAFLAGIILVVLILVLNLTVAIGTLNSIIFYANILYVSRSAYFTQRHLTVFISWINLDIGFDSCFFDGMDTYAKTWLQLAFPLFIIFLVVMIIWVSSCSTRFSNLIGRRNPVATLATLILLSYTKLLQVVIASFSFVILKFPNGKSSTRWLPDASLEYSEGKLIALICVALVILIIGLIYTTVIFSWQWLLQLSSIKLFAWTKNQKLHTFINTYNHPYNAKHRYWTGLLLLVRVLVYLVYAFSVSADPRITLLFTVIIMCCLIMYKTVRNAKIYKNRLLNAMESFVLFNIATFAAITLYTFNELDNIHEARLQAIAAYFSVVTIVILCLVVILYHAYRYGSSKVYTVIHDTTLCQRMTAALTYNRSSLDQSTPLASETKLFDLLDRERTVHFRGYTPPNKDSHQGPSTTQVSLEHAVDAADESNSFLNHLDADRDLSSSASVTPRRAGERDIAKLRPVSEAPIIRSTTGDMFDLRRKTDSAITLKSFTPNNKDITKPLLAEDKVS